MTKDQKTKLKKYMTDKYLTRNKEQLKADEIIDNRDYTSAKKIAEIAFKELSSDDYYKDIDEKDCINAYIDACADIVEQEYNSNDSRFKLFNEKMNPTIEDTKNEERRRAEEAEKAGEAEKTNENGEQPRRKRTKTEEQARAEYEEASNVADEHERERIRKQAEADIINARTTNNMDTLVKAGIITKGMAEGMKALDSLSILSSDEGKKHMTVADAANYLSYSQRATPAGKKIAKQFEKVAGERAKLGVEIEALSAEYLKFIKSHVETTLEVRKKQMEKEEKANANKTKEAEKEAKKDKSKQKTEIKEKPVKQSIWNKMVTSFMSLGVISAIRNKIEEAKANKQERQIDNSTPDNSTPDNSTPSNGTPNNGTPNNGTPNNGTPNNGTSNNGTPNNGTPDNGTPNNGTPSNGTPNNSTPSNGTPNNSTPSNETPSNGTPSNGTPSNGTPDNGTPSNGIPDDGTPDDGTPDDFDDPTVLPRDYEFYDEEPYVAESDGAESDGAESDGAESDGAESDGAESDGAESNGAESDGAESNGAESNGAESNGAESNGAESNGAESNSAESESSENISANKAADLLENAKTETEANAGVEANAGADAKANVNEVVDLLEKADGEAEASVEASAETSTEAGAETSTEASAETSVDVEDIPIPAKSAKTGDIPFDENANTETVIDSIAKSDVSEDITQITNEAKEQAHNGTATAQLYRNLNNSDNKNEIKTPDDTRDAPGK